MIADWMARKLAQQALRPITKRVSLQPLRTRRAALLLHVALHHSLRGLCELRRVLLMKPKKMARLKKK